MRILRNYLLREFLGPLVMGLLLLTFVMLLGNLVKIAQLVINKGVDILVVSKLFLFMAPYLLTYTLPIAVLTATLIALGRLSSDNEIVAIRASGINPMRLIAPLWFMGLALSLLLVIFNDRVIPWAHFATRKTLIELGMKNPTAALEPGVFITSFQKYVLFIYEIEENKLTNIRIYEPQEDRPTRTIVARRGEFIINPENKTVKLKLVDGTADEPDPEDPTTFYKLNFKTYFMTLNMAQGQDKDAIRKKPSDMTIRELEEEIEYLKEERIDPLPLLTEINKKIALAFSCLVFVIFGSPLAVITRRREKSLNLGLAVVTVGLYYLIFIGTEALSLHGLLPPHVAMWIPNAALTLTGILLTIRLCAS